MARSESRFRYLPVSERDRDWGLWVTNGGLERVASGAAYPPPGHPAGYAFGRRGWRVLDEFQLHFIAAGSGVFRCGAEEQAVLSGSVFLLFPGVAHSYAPDPEQGWDEYWVGFDGPRARELWERGFFRAEAPVLAMADEQQVAACFNELLDLLGGARLGFMQQLAAVVEQLLAHCHAAALGRRRKASREERAVREARAFIEAAVDEPVSLEVLALRLQVGYAWLRRVFRDHTGMTLKQYQLAVRLNHARDLLCDDTLSIKQVAARSGFPDAQYFSRLFKRKCGRSPGAWRKAVREGA